MPISLHFGMPMVAGFVLALTRVGCALFMLPLPGFKDAATTVRIVLVVSITFCLFPSWPMLSSDVSSGVQFTLALLAEMAAGLLLGLAVAILHDCFQFAAQAISVQTGFSMASINDPSSKADTGVLLFMTQLTTGLLFFSLDVYHFMLRMLARSFDMFPLDSHALQQASVQTVIHLAGMMFVVGLKLGLPMVFLLMMIDIAVALLSRLHSQLQLTSMTFPVKTLLSFVFLGVMIARWPTIYQQLAMRIFDEIGRLGAF